MFKKFQIMFVLVLALTAQDEFSSSKSTVGGYGELHINSVKDGDKATKTTADFHRFVLFYGYNFSDKWSFKSEVELEHNYVKDGNGELELEQAYIDYHHSDQFGFRAGVVLAPVGYINEIHEPPTFFGLERPSFDKYILPTTWFDNGASIYGRINEQFVYNITIMGGLDGDALGNNQGIRSGRTKGYNDDMDGYNYNNPTWIARADYIGLEGLNVGASYTFNNARRMVGAGIAVNLIDLHAKYNIDNIHAKAQFGLISYNDQLDFKTTEGILAELGYDLIKGEEMLAPFFRYEDLNRQKDHIDKATEEKSHVSIITFGASYKPLSQVVFKADYSIEKSKIENATSKKIFGLGVGYMF
jgi:hypothetical protein